MSHQTQDRILAARYVDQQLASDEQAAFAVRLQAEPALQAMVAELQAMRGLFAVAGAEPMPPLRAGFAERVSQRLRREVGEVTASGELEHKVVVLARWCVLAAAVLFTVALLWGTGVLRSADAGKLQADNGSSLIRNLDEQIRAAETAPARR